MKSPSFEIKLAKGWSEIEPQNTSLRLVFWGKGGLNLYNTDFSVVRNLIAFDLGGLASPFAIDEKNGFIYCNKKIEASPKNAEGFRNSLAGSHILQINIKENKIETIAESPENYVFNWLLSLAPTNDCLISQLHPLNWPQENFKLAIINITSRSMKVIDLEDKPFHPEAVSFQYKQIIVSGMMLAKFKIGLFDFSGKIVSCPLIRKDFRHLHGADFYEKRNLIALGGGWIYLWDRESNSLTKKYSSGKNPVFSPDGKHIWFLIGDSAVYQLEVKSGKARKIVEFMGDTAKNVPFCWGPPVVISEDGRYVLARLTRKWEIPAKELEQKKKSYPPEILEKMSEDSLRIKSEHISCILDTVKRNAWKYPVLAVDALWTELQ